MPQIDRREGRRLFGADPIAYESARPGHAERVYELLVGCAASVPARTSSRSAPAPGRQLAGCFDGLDASPSSGKEGRPGPLALDTGAWFAALEHAGFRATEHDVVDWDACWDTNGIRALYGTFSPIARLDEERRDEILDAVAHIAEHEFGGRVERTLLTSIFTARKPG